MTINFKKNQLITFFIISITLLSLSSNLLEGKSVTYEKIYLSDDIDILKLDYILRFKINNANKEYNILIVENSKLVENKTINSELLFCYFLNYGNNSLIIQINHQIVVNQYFYIEGTSDTINFDVLVFAIIVLIISFFVIRYLKDYFLNDF